MGVECVLILSRENNLCHTLSTEALNVRFTISSPLYSQNHKSKHTTFNFIHNQVYYMYKNILTNKK